MILSLPLQRALGLGTTEHSHRKHLGAVSGRYRPLTVPPVLSMAVRPQQDPGVYRYWFLIDGRQAFFYVDWQGSEHPLRVVGDDETEAEVIAELESAMGSEPSRSRSSRRDRPALFLV